MPIDLRIKSEAIDLMCSRILVVDDEPAIRELVVDFLTDEGYQVESAVDGLEAARKFEDSRFDAVIADVMMPRVDGFGLIERIRQVPHGRCVPVFLMSAVDSVNGHTDDATLFLHKPFDISVLLEALAEHVPPEGPDK